MKLFVGVGVLVIYTLLRTIFESFGSYFSILIKLSEEATTMYNEMALS